MIIDDGDLVFSWSATLAVRHWDRGRALLNQHLFRVDPLPDVSRRWLGYVLQVGLEYLRPLMHGSAMTHITLDMLRMLTVAVPHISQQRAIADYLDTETGRIDALLTKKRRMIELLKERRYSVITTAVNGAEGSVSLRGSSRTTGSRRAGGAMVTIGPSILRLANFVNGSAFRPSDLGGEGLAGSQDTTTIGQPCPDRPSGTT